MQKFDVKWTKEWSRIRSLFMKIKGKHITIYSIGFEYHLECNGNAMGAAEHIAKELAGKPIKDTEAIIKSLIKID